MSKKNTDKKYVKNPDIIDSKIDDEMVMMNVDKGTYFGLDSIGSAIWEALDTPHSLNDLVAKLTEQFDVAEKQCKEDITPFLTNLKKADLLIEVE